jgi:dolichol-phosphate mannosyltransferase
VKVVIIVPTYNEKENIGLLIESLQVVFATMRHEMGILVVDDSSPDGTAHEVRSKMAIYSNVFLISGDRKGLGAAYIRGMIWVMETLYPDAVMEMDADFSHDPVDVPRLVAAIEDGADFVIGSRYVVGGSIPNDWGFHRRLNSKAGNFFARYVAGMYPISDCTAGFRAIRMALLKEIPLNAMNVMGYAFQIALLNEAILRKAVIREVPVAFVDRMRGETKLGIFDIVEFMKRALQIRIRNSKRMLQFCAVGSVGVVVNLGCFTVLYGGGMNKFLASPIAIEISIISNFLMNNAWTFSDGSRSDHIVTRMLKFNLVAFSSLAVSYGLFVFLCIMLPDVLPQWNQVVGIIPATMVNYGLNSSWTFRVKTM